MTKLLLLLQAVFTGLYNNVIIFIIKHPLLFLVVI